MIGVNIKITKIIESKSTKKLLNVKQKLYDGRLWIIIILKGLRSELLATKGLTTGEIIDQHRKFFGYRLGEVPHVHQLLITLDDVCQKQRDTKTGIEFWTAVDVSSIRKNKTFFLNFRLLKLRICQSFSVEKKINPNTRLSQWVHRSPIDGSSPMLRDLNWYQPPNRMLRLWKLPVVSKDIFHLLRMSDRQQLNYCVKNWNSKK